MVAFLFLITGLVFQIMARPPKKDEENKEGKEKKEEGEEKKKEGEEKKKEGEETKKEGKEEMVLRQKTTEGLTRTRFG